MFTFTYGAKGYWRVYPGWYFSEKDFMDAGVGCIHYGQIYTYSEHTQKKQKHIFQPHLQKNAEGSKGKFDYRNY